MANPKKKKHPTPRATPSVIQITFITPPDGIGYDPNPAQAVWGQPVEWHCADPFSVHFDFPPNGTPFDTADVVGVSSGGEFVGTAIANKGPGSKKYKYRTKGKKDSLDFADNSADLQIDDP